jgi:PAS domain S-box-containing protein
MTRKIQLVFGALIATTLLGGAFFARLAVLSDEYTRWIHFADDVRNNVQRLSFSRDGIESNSRRVALRGNQYCRDASNGNQVYVEGQETNAPHLGKDNFEQSRQPFPFGGVTTRNGPRSGTVILLRPADELVSSPGPVRVWSIRWIWSALRKLRKEELTLLVDTQPRKHLVQGTSVLIIGTLLSFLLVSVTGGTLQGSQAEEALRDCEDKYRMLLDEIGDYAIFMLNPAGQIVSCNAGAERIKGYTAEQIIGHSFSCFFPPEDIKSGRPEEVLRMTAASGRHEEHGMRVRRDGSQFLASVTFTALRDSAGILRGFSEISRDLSEIRESGAKYRGLLEAAPDAMVVVNQGGEIVLLNVQAEKQFGYRRDELVGQKVKNIIPEGFSERLVADSTRSAADALAQQIGTGIELSGRRKDGSEFPIEIMLSPLESAEGILVTAAIRDISVRKDAEKHLVKTVGELKRSNDELQHFAYVASHDLQEPLRMVASYTQLLAKRYKGRLDSDADEFIAFAVDGCTRMQGLIHDLLAYSRAGTNGKTICEVSAEDALNEALANLRVTIEESDAIVTHDSLPAIRTDDTQLAQVFQNLVGNAVKYRSVDVPRVHVSAANNGRNEWIFSVQDNGLGIDPQYFERIFILFQRLHGRNEFEGTGIGLAICKKIVERLGGRIWVESQPGKGSAFYFALPERDEKR